MPTPSQKAMNVASDPNFHARVRLALVRVALVAIDDDNSARAAFARKVLNGSVNLPAASVAVIANASISASIAAKEEASDDFGVDDASIDFVVAENNNPAVGVFHKLAMADAGD